MASNIDSAVTSDSATDTQGADVGGGSEAVAEHDTASAPVAEPDAAKPASPAKRMQARLTELRTAGDADRKAPNSTKLDGANRAGPADEANKQAGDDVAVHDVKKDEDGPVPKKVFLARLGKETEKRRAAEERAASKELEARKAVEALKIANELVERYRRAAAEGKPLDARDEQLLSYELANRARDAAQRLDGEHRQALQAATQQEADAQQHADLVERYGRDLQQALAEHTLVSRAELIAEMRKPANARRSFSEVAREIEAPRLEIARSRMSSERPPHPTTVKPKAGGHVVHRSPPSAKGLLSKLNEIKQRNA